MEFTLELAVGRSHQLLEDAQRPPVMGHVRARGEVVQTEPLRGGHTGRRLEVGHGWELGEVMEGQVPAAVVAPKGLDEPEARVIQVQPELLLDDPPRGSGGVLEVTKDIVR